MHSSVRAVYRIAAGADGPGAARQVVDAEFAERVPELVLERLKLLISEIVTNRIVNALDGRDQRIILDLRSDRVVRCAVVDHGPATLPQGLVLRLVDEFADRWGITRSCDLTQMWFETGASASVV
jgi:anti-sigma regulatory factor (Ser/Thr protein kinase)